MTHDFASAILRTIVRGRLRTGRRFIVVKILRCGDVMPGCNCLAVMEGKDDAEVMQKAAEHAKTAHGMPTIPQEVVEKVRAAIQDKLPQSARGTS
jgi:predicted small metal-binding protein